MIRPIIIIVNLIIALFFKFFLGTPTAEVKAPSSVKAGETFVVNVTIATNGETDFMRYSMDLPEGWTAEKGGTDGASFKFEKQVVKFLWSRVGEQKELKISFKVTPPASASGDFTLNNKLSHTVDNLPSNIELTPIAINVIGNGSAVTPTEKTVVDSTAKPPVVISIERTVPTEEVADEFVVDIVIHKEDLKSFGKIEDTLPSGFTAKLIKADGADFKFENGVVKFSWFVLPIKPTLNVQYRVSVAPGTKGLQVINGHFSYVENENGKLLAISPSAVKIKETITEPVVTNTTPDNTTDKTADKTADNTTSTTTDKVADNSTTKTNDNSSSGNSTEKTNPQETNTGTGITEPTTAAATGVNFSVQIAAMTRMVPVSYYATTYHLSGTINAEMDNGLNKYSTGSFPTYQAARDSREQVKNSGVSDAFVTAHSNGKRITVQEALMITSQKWVR